MDRVDLLILHSVAFCAGLNYSPSDLRLWHILGVDCRMIYEG